VVLQGKHFSRWWDVGLRSWHKKARTWPRLGFGAQF
jgi:hypothetical protein